MTTKKYKKLSNEIGIDIPTIKSLVKVESGGSGFLSNGKPKILFEGHIFWRELRKRGLDPKNILNQSKKINSSTSKSISSYGSNTDIDEYLSLSSPNEINNKSNKSFMKISEDLSDVLYKKWTKQYYLGGIKEYERLDKAKNIHEEAALASASWGSFQIMGFNYKKAGYSSVKEFVTDQVNINGQIKSFLNFIKNDNRMLKALKKKNWAKFASLYNGPAYKKNEYDIKLKKYYDKFLKEEKESIAAEKAALLKTWHNKDLDRKKNIRLRSCLN